MCEYTHEGVNVEISLDEYVQLRIDAERWLSRIAEYSQETQKAKKELEELQAQLEVMKGER